MRGLAVVAATFAGLAAAPGRLDAQTLAMPAVLPYPAATSLCSQHVTGAPVAGQPGPHIEWTAYHSADPPDLVVAWYSQRLGAAAHRREDVQDIWRLPADAPQAVVTVTAAADYTPRGDCATTLPAKARTVVMLSSMTRPAAPTPAATPGAKRFSRSFPATGVKKLVLRAEAAATAHVTTSMDARTIDVAGLPESGAAGYHPSDPNWRETPADRWGLDFVSARRGDVLVVSSTNERGDIHHRYAFTSLTVRVPIGVEVVKERRQLTHDGAPDLR
jgi:hypothetical protein